MCDMTHSYVRHDSFVCATWLIHIPERGARDSTYVAMPTFIYMCDMTHTLQICDMTHSHTEARGAWFDTCGDHARPSSPCECICIYTYIYIYIYVYIYIHTFEKVVLNIKINYFIRMRSPGAAVWSLRGISQEWAIALIWMWHVRVYM